MQLRSRHWPTTHSQSASLFLSLSLSLFHPFYHLLLSSLSLAHTLSFSPSLSISLVSHSQNLSLSQFLTLDRSYFHTLSLCSVSIWKNVAIKGDLWISPTPHPVKIVYFDAKSRRKKLPHVDESESIRVRTVTKLDLDLWQKKVWAIGSGVGDKWCDAVCGSSARNCTLVCIKVTSGKDKLNVFFFEKWEK